MLYDDKWWKSPKENLVYNPYLFISSNVVCVLEELKKVD